VDGHCDAGKAAGRSPRRPERGPYVRRPETAPNPRPARGQRPVRRRCRPSLGKASVSPHEVDAPVSFNHEANRAGGCQARPAPSAVGGRRSACGDAADLDLVSGGSRTTARPRRRRERARARRRDDRRAGSSLRSEGRSRRSRCAWEISTAPSIPGLAGSGARRRRCATREPNTGSVSSRTPESSSRTVVWPSKVSLVGNHRGCVMRFHDRTILWEGDVAGLPEPDRTDQRPGCPAWSR
jgi:hypothetical protein